MLTRAVGESRVSMPEVIDQQCGLVQSLQIIHSALAGIVGNMKVCSELFFIIDRINQVQLLVFGRVYIPVNVASVNRAISYLLDFN